MIDLDLREPFGKEFDVLSEEANKVFGELFASLKNMQEIPPITNLDISEQLEHAHFCIYVNAMNVSQVALRLSQMYHYNSLIMDAIEKQNKSDDLLDKSDLL